MAPRRLEQLLTLAAFVLLAGQGLLLASLWNRPEAPEALPEVEEQAPRRRKRTPPTQATVAPDADRAAVVLLDQMLAERVTAAAARRGVDPRGRGPSEAQRQAALADPDPAGPAVLALVDAWSAALVELGESFDATSSLGSAAAP